MTALKSLVTGNNEIAITKLQTQKDDPNIPVRNGFFCIQSCNFCGYKPITKLQTGGRYYVY
jgi:hypothetical protein